VPANQAELESRAYDVADEYRDGRFAHLAGKDWRDAWRALVAELASRCPGFSEAEYDKTLETGFRILASLQAGTGISPLRDPAIG
jgi:hypothetical protein